MRGRVVVLFLSLTVIVAVGVTSAYAASEYRLTRRHVFPGSGFSIAYPQGWLVGNSARCSFIAQSRADHKAVAEADTLIGMVERGTRVEGYVVITCRRHLSFFQALGLPKNATLNDLEEHYARFVRWEKPTEVTSATLFGVAARRVKARSVPGWGIFMMGFTKDEGFILSLLAPTRQALDAFEPTWTRMLKSIERVK